jgi:uncharacterized membrane protein YjgN (DUF898 family)
MTSYSPPPAGLQDPPRRAAGPAVPYQPDPAQAAPLSLAFRFDGGAATWVGVRIAGFFVTLCTLGICYPWAVVMQYRWQAKHTYINGYRLQFTGTAIGLFGHWIKWLLLSIITLGIYLFWVVPRLTKWVVEHQAVDVYVAQTTALQPVDY